MTTAATYPALSIDETGVAMIRGTRYKVLHLAAEHYQHGWTAEELLRQHPDLQPAQVYAALAFFYEHREEMLTELKQAAETLKQPGVNTLSRDRLHRRLTLSNE